MSSQEQQTARTAAEKYWSDLEQKYPDLDVYAEYGMARSKLNGRHPTGHYFKCWLEQAAQDILPLPPEGKCAKAWTPPTEENVMDYCLGRKWAAGFGRHAWSTFVANGWKHYGERITSDAQWKAIMDVMQWNP